MKPWANQTRWTDELMMSLLADRKTMTLDALADKHDVAQARICAVLKKARAKGLDRSTAKP
jgi:hypothetical protein